MKAVVLSPHLDDAVMSIGATINSLRRRGAEVMMLTAFAGDPNRNDLASYWDAKRGATADKAHVQTKRRTEDDAATAILQIESVHLPFDDISYVARRDPDEIWSAIEPHVADADVLLTPGWPLVHSDHRYLSTLVVRAYPGQVLYYEELPYGAEPIQFIKRTLRGRRAAVLAHIIGSELTWRPTLTNAEDFAAKRTAVACYEGEVLALGRSARFGQLHDRIARREVVGFTETAEPAPFVFGGVR